MQETELKYSSFRFTALIWKGSVVVHVLPKVIFFIVWAACVVAINRWGFSLKTSDFLVSTMVLVLSLLLVFRTNTAYDRYWEGRRLWSSLTSAIRSMARNVWIYVKEDDDEDRLAKVKVINLLIAYPFSIKHYLREEYGTHYEDLSQYIQDIPRYSTPSSIQPMVLDLPTQVNLPNSQVQLIQMVEGPLRPTNLPLEIAYFLSSYVTEVTKANQITNPVITALMANVNLLIECLSGFERILRTPIPAAYSVHLTQCLWLFCLSLPFQLLYKFTPESNNDWLVIMIVAIVVFTAFGIVNIGEEIENPFGYDANDLPLDEYCEILKKELVALFSRPPPKVADWMIRPTDTQAVPNLAS